jgi:hypothetical protein
VDGVEILKPPRDRFLAFSGGRDTVEVYDIELLRHPSFSVSGFLVHNCSDDLYRSVRPMLAVSRGRLLALSTPFGQRGFFFEEWERAAEAARKGLPATWHTVRVRATECPRITPDFLAEERIALGARWYRQEYETSFEEAVDAVFAFEDIQAALRNDITPMFGE